jgi:c-di-GMP-related signal transduction protein
MRARFCELIAPKLKHNQSKLYLIGLLSLVDAILEVPMGVAIEGLRSHPIRLNFSCAKTDKRTPLSAISDLMVAREGAIGRRLQSWARNSIYLSFCLGVAQRGYALAHQLTEAGRPSQIK